MEKAKTKVLISDTDGMKLLLVDSMNENGDLDNSESRSVGRE